ncbi:MAG: hypothetical protein PHN78_02045 [Dehalococcoidales bacterium]|nr:hypothetical protein [Dehalococcoidales bacterium]
MCHNGKGMNNEVPYSETRQERREKKLKKRRERIAQHGKGLAKVYMNAVMKRLKRQRK